MKHLIAVRRCFGVSLVRPPSRLSVPKSRIIGLILGILLVTCTAAWAVDPHLALATSAHELYIFRDQGKWGTQSWASVYFNAQTTLTGVATDGRYVYVADASGTLTVGAISDVLGTPSWTTYATVTLRDAGNTKRVYLPRQIAADGLGGVYVTGQYYYENSTDHSVFAHVKSTSGSWGTPIVSLGDLGSSPMDDVAVGKSGASAIIAHRKNTPVTNGSQTSIATENLISATNALGTQARNARAVAVDTSLGVDGYAYVVSRNADSPATKGSVSVVNAATGALQASGAILFPAALPGETGMLPDDVTTFAIDATHRYLGVMGLNNGQGQLWKVLLDETSDWAPILSGTPTSINVASTGAYESAASADGRVFWYTTDTGTIGAIDTMTWTPLAGAVFNGKVADSGVEIGSIIGYVPVVIPEPSSLLSLAGLLCTGFGLIRRRTRRA